MKRIVIVGGGISGLAAANRVVEVARDRRETVAVTVMEGSSRLGGSIQSETRDAFLIERGADSFLSEKPEAVSLAQRLGLEDNLIQTNKEHRRTFIVRNGRLTPVPAGFHLLAPSLLWPFINSGILSFAGKARMALDLLLPRKDSTSADVSLAEFTRRRLGQEVLERIAQPMIGGIYLADPEKLSLRATMPRFLEFEHQHGSVIRGILKQGVHREARNEKTDGGARYSLFLSFDRGMQCLTDRLADKINASGFGSIQLNTRVTSLELIEASADEPAKWIVRNDRNETLDADALCLALPSFISAQLLQDVDKSLADQLREIPYTSSAVVNLAYRSEHIPHALAGFGFVVPFVEKRSLIACTFSSVKFSGRAPDGCVLLRAFLGGALQPELATFEDSRLLSFVRTDLRDLLGIEREPLFADVMRWPNSMPQYHVGHLDRVERIEECVGSLPALALAGNAYRGVGIPDCIGSGETAADQLLNTLK
ncbi:MAG TPA: protoporphyrinogen oxidase [Pyrinomonadaceae bacterium]|nr:protoporphyrinogen oxidase [Pyrinomonadaceae bacterium]